VAIDQPPGQGQEDRAGEAGDDGDGEQRLRSALRGEPGDDDRERRFVQAGRGGGAVEVCRSAASGVRNTAKA
jgi:hypothetical protein